MITRLIEQQESRLHEQSARKRQPHTPTSRETLRRPLLIRLAEAQTRKKRRSARRSRRGVHVRQTSMHIAQPRIEFVARVVRRF